MLLKVNEFFGPTFQGEGPFVGQLSHFLRLNRCNLTCTWCDTPYTWAFTEEKAFKHQQGIIYDREQNESLWNLDEFIKVMETNFVRFLVITGGEPLLQAKVLQEFIDEMPYETKIQFETAGTLDPLTWGPDDDVHYVVSPKLNNSGNDLDKRYKPNVLRRFVEKNANFKFVCQNEDDLNEVWELATDVNIPDTNIWIMPEGAEPSTMMMHAKKLADPVLARGWNMTLRMHTLLWGDERGR